MACKSDQYGTQWRNAHFQNMQIIKISESSSFCGDSYLLFPIFSVIADWKMVQSYHGLGREVETFLPESRASKIDHAIKLRWCSS